MLITSATSFQPQTNAHTEFMQHLGSSTLLIRSLTSPLVYFYALL
jgi:hypothetical protein